MRRYRSFVVDTIASKMRRLSMENMPTIDAIEICMVKLMKSNNDETCIEMNLKKEKHGIKKL